MGKGCDHEIVRALETNPKVMPCKIEIEVHVVHKGSAMTYSHGLAT